MEHKTVEAFINEHPEFVKKLMENPIMGVEANMVRQPFLTKAIKEHGMIDTVKTDLYQLAQAVTMNDANADEAVLSQTVSMVYTLISEGRVNDLYRAMMFGFPEYFNLSNMSSDERKDIAKSLDELKASIDNGSLFNQLFK